MIVDENLNDSTNKVIEILNTIIKKYKISLIVMTGIVILMCFALSYITILCENEIKDNKILKEQLYKDETELALEHSIGYWFINKPEQINDSILYLFLKDNNAWYPEILLKQAKLESGNFTSDVWINANNPYGMRKAKKRFNLQVGEYKGYGKYTNWCTAALDRIIWDIEFFGTKPSKEEYLKAMSVYAEDSNYIFKIQ